MTEEPVPEDAEPQERRYPSTVGGLFYLCVLAVAAVGIALTGLSGWRLGVQVFATALVAAAALRLALPGRDAGMLKVRHRLVDVALLGAVGLTLMFLAASIPDQVPL